MLWTILTTQITGNIYIRDQYFYKMCQSLISTTAVNIILVGCSSNPRPFTCTAAPINWYVVVT